MLQQLKIGLLHIPCNVQICSNKYDGTWSDQRERYQNMPFGFLAMCFPVHGYLNPTEGVTDVITSEKNPFGY